MWKKFDEFMPIGHVILVRDPHGKYFDSEMLLSVVPIIDFFGRLKYLELFNGDYTENQAMRLYSEEFEWIAVNDYFKNNFNAESEMIDSGEPQAHGYVDQD